MWCSESICTGDNSYTSDSSRALIDFPVGDMNGNMETGDVSDVVNGGDGQQCTCDSLKLSSYATTGANTDNSNSNSHQRNLTYEETIHLLEQKIQVY